MMFRIESDRISRGDQVGLWAFVVFGVLTALATVWSVGVRIAEVTANRDVQVAADFAGTTAQAPIGPDGSAVELVLERATLTVPSLPGASVAALVIQQMILAVGVVTVVICLSLLIRNISAGQVFSATSTRLVTVASIAAFATYAAFPFFGNMAANGAFARLSDRSFDNVVMSADIGGLVMGGFAAALASTVFAVGDRLRRETDGLV